MTNKNIPTLQLKTFGGLSIELDGRPLTNFVSTKAEALLIYLALNPRQHPRETLADLLWDDRTQRQAMSNLRTVLYSLRKEVAPFVTISRKTAAINPESNLTIDALQLETAVPQAGIQSEAQAQEATQALDLYKGDFLAGFFLPEAAEFESWTAAQRENLHRTFVGISLQLGRWHIDQHEYAAAITTATRLLQIDPLAEAGHRQLMEALARNNQRAESLAQYQRCQDILAEELDLEPEIETQTLYETIRAGRQSDFVSELSQAKTAGMELTERLTPNNLPLPKTSFIGRNDELAELDQLLADMDSRLVTIIGPGGMGKTRLALAAAASVLKDQDEGLDRSGPSRFADGIFFVALEALDSAEQIPAAINNALGFRPSADDPVARSPWRQTVDYLRSKRLILIMDNFEQLLDGVHFLVDILEKAPEIMILVTSREKLALRGERLYPLQGMIHPEQTLTGIDTGQLIDTFSAPQLFIQSAARLRPDFTLDTDEVPDLMSICQLVEGMPLGLELAAGWVELLSLGDIVAEIRQNLEILETKIRDVPERQRSMTAVFDSSWNQLGLAEQVVLKQMSVFRGGFDRKAAKQVSGASLRQLATLSEKSLVQYDKGQDRFEIHRLLRQYLAERLAEDGDAECAAQDRHSAYYCDRLRLWGQDLKGSRQREAIIEMETESQNIRTAWSWAAAQPRIHNLDQAVEGLSLFYLRSGRLQEIEKACQVATERLSGTENAEELRVLAKILARQGWFLDDETDKSLVQKSLELLSLLEEQGHDVQAEKAYSLMRLADITMFIDAEETARLISQSMVLYQTLGDKWGEAELLRVRAHSAHNQGSFDVARELHTRILQIRRSLDDRIGRIFALMGLADVARYQGHFEEALKLNEECVNLLEEDHNLLTLANALGGLAFTLLFSGRFEESITALSKRNKNYEELGLNFPSLGVFIFLNKVMQGDYEAARKFDPVEENDLFNTWGMTVVYLYQYQGFMEIIAGRYLAADHLFEKTFEIYKNMTRRSEIAVALIGRALALRGLGKIEEGAGHLLEALRVTLDTKGTISLMYLLPAAASFLVSYQRPQRAITIYETALQFPHVANAQLFEDLVGAEIKAVAAELPPEVVEEAKSRGRKADLWQTAETLLHELTAEKES